jgi:nucleotide-binding universal stress UspA family protein
MAGLIVVGVDGSEPARLAARWAAHEAQLRAAEVLLVSAWEVPTYAFTYGGSAGLSDQWVSALRELAETRVAEASEAIRAIADRVVVSTRVVEGQAASVLLEAADGADLLVVGSRGLGGFRELLLGSVSQQCASPATCPVVVVRATE